MLNDEQYRLQIKIPHFSSANNGPQMTTFQVLPDILPSWVHVAIYLWFHSDSSALHVMVCCWIWQCTTASVCLNNECLLINDDQNSGCQYDFNNTALVLRGRSAVKCGRFRSTCMSQHSQRSEWQNTGCHHKLEPYLTVIFSHYVRRDPDKSNTASIYSPTMLIKLLRYRHGSSSYPAWKEVPLFTSADQILTRYGVARYRK